MLDDARLPGEDLAWMNAEELRAAGMSKSYGATVALEHADIQLKAGEVHALLGENGAGKSTLVRILTGAVVPDRGTMTLHGEAYSPASIGDARLRGVATAFQELSLVPNLTVGQNLLLPVLPKNRFSLVSGAGVIDQSREILERHGLQRLDPRAEVSQLPLPDRQRLEIVRAIHNAERVLVLDEPTAALAETDWLFDQIAKATLRGVAVLYISHRLAEVRAICTRATVLRNGRTIASVGVHEASDDDIFEMMVGRRVEHGRTADRRSMAATVARLSVSGLTSSRLTDISFDLQAGEVLGVAALEGQGQRELFRTLAGLQGHRAGRILVDGKEVKISSPRRALSAGSGLAYLPEERKTEGILAGLSAGTNIVLPIMSRISSANFIGRRSENRAARPEAEKVEMNPRYLDFAIGDLSGGNQQKALIARTLATGAQTLLLFDPTRGVDVGTKQSIYTAMRAFAAKGGSVLFYSSELPEIVQLADRCLVLYDGRIERTFTADEFTEQRLVAAMIGHSSHTQGADAK